mmetsp:Transcript_37006/g.80868  ORF Transcript_37006/g.80868 Transcript_37006/m.80868 type:complete len:297 (-) Transcript_37006:613-1503(-)
MLRYGRLHLGLRTFPPSGGWSRADFCALRHIGDGGGWAAGALGGIRQGNLLGAVPFLKRLQWGNFKPDLRSEVLQISLLRREQNGHARPCGAKPGGAPAAVQIGLLVAREIQIDNQVDLGYVYSSGHDVRTDQGPKLRRLQAHESLLAPLLVHSSAGGRGGYPHLRQNVRRLRCGLRPVAKYHGLAERDLSHHVEQNRHFVPHVVPLHHVHVMGYPSQHRAFHLGGAWGGAGLVALDGRGTQEELGRQRPDVGSLLWYCDPLLGRPLLKLLQMVALRILHQLLCCGNVGRQKRRRE